MLLAQRVQRLTEGDEITGDQPGSLMNQLIERMLAIGAGLTPINRAGVPCDAIAIDGDVLAVTLHRQLLEIRGKPLQVLLVREYADALGAEEVVVPDRQQAHQHWKVARERRGTKVLVDLVTTIEHRAEIFRADRDHR